MPPRSSDLGRLVQELVNRVSHRGGGRALRLMEQAGVTLPQVLLLTRVQERGECTVSDLAHSLNLTPSAVSQAADKLVQSKLLTRVEDVADRRRKRLALAARGNKLLDEVVAARADQYAAELERLDPSLRWKLADVIHEVLNALAREKR